MADEIIDYGNWIVPSSWNDVSLKQYQEIEKFYEGKDDNVDVREIVHILCDKTIDEVNQLPMDFLEEIMEKLAFMQETPEVGKPSNKIVVDNVEYGVNIMEKLKTGEWISLDTIVKNDRHNYAAMLAVLCRKEGEIYDSRFEAEVFDERQKMWEKQPLVKILPLITFFLNLWVVSRKHSQLYMEVEEAINLIQKRIETSENLGVWRKFCMKWQMRNLRKSLKSNSNTSQISLPFYPTLSRKAKWKSKKILFKKQSERQSQSISNKLMGKR